MNSPTTTEKSSNQTEKENSHIVTDPVCIRFCFVIKLEITEFFSRFILSLHSNFPFFFLALLRASQMTCERGTEGRGAQHIVIYPLILQWCVCVVLLFFFLLDPCFSFFFYLHFPALHLCTAARKRAKERETSLLVCTHHAMENASCFFSVYANIPILCLVCPSFISTCSCIVLQQSHFFAKHTRTRTHKVEFIEHTNGAHKTQRVM